MINFNKNASNFYSYMESLTLTHNDFINENDSPNTKHFFQGELEEFYKGLRSRVAFPALVVEGFQLNLTDNLQWKYRETAFTVVFDYDEDNDYQQITNCFSLSENIGLEILRKINTDAKELPCQIRISDVTGIQILNETDRYAGIRFSFSIQSSN